MKLSSVFNLHHFLELRRNLLFHLKNLFLAVDLVTQKNSDSLEGKIQSSDR
ncbi:hypothetical protein GXM_02575 [Nostoc sphaeroides CCNUC1]|uniref:Uncharacterized protein n=1 Tax=Nostoc sphaeroides CCNUC1 TaxID=2653204 RepID=A0A5P8VXI7_9NOSO|nr:hypothetical protein GXM_02575 [Nostoc sphaeroides CCNUC1]